jgi:hypothetical protein
MSQLFVGLLVNLQGLLYNAVFCREARTRTRNSPVHQPHHPQSVPPKQVRREPAFLLSLSSPRSTAPTENYKPRPAPFLSDRRIFLVHALSGIRHGAPCKPMGAEGERGRTGGMVCCMLRKGALDGRPRHWHGRRRSHVAVADVLGDEDEWVETWKK